MNIEKYLKELNGYMPALDEQHRQLEKWGLQNHHPHVYMSILTEEVGEVAQAILKTEGEGQTKTWDDVIEELVQVQAVAMSMIQSIQRNQINNDAQEGNKV
jgi:NTP pyrophosphatase (non-canonical NTP hydrolase)